MIEMLILGIFSIITAVALPNININSILINRTGFLVLIFTIILSLNIIDFEMIEKSLSLYNNLFNVTLLNLFIEIFIYFIGRICLLGNFSLKNNKLRKNNDINEYSLIILFSLCGSAFLICSCDLISIYLSIELQSFAIYILAAINRDSENSTSAGLKYFLLGGLSSRLILFGSRIIYSFSRLTNLEIIYSFLSVINNENFSMEIVLGFLFLIIGFLFKISAAPFHNWAPDVYDGVPTNVTIWLRIMPKIAIFVFLLELISGLSLLNNFNIRNDLSMNFDLVKNLLLFSSLFSLIIGTIVGLAQTKIKRLLTYSTISHVGFILLRLSINSQESIESYLFYLIQYTLTNLNIFLILLRFGFFMKKNIQYNFNEKNQDINFINEFSGQFYQNPLLGIAITICLFSIRGVPPLIGFFGKQYVLYSRTHAGYYFISLIAILVSVISASYYLKIIRIIHFDKLSLENGKNSEKNIYNENQLTNLHSLVISLLTLVITLFVFKTNIILDSISLLALSIFNL